MMRARLYPVRWIAALLLAGSTAASAQDRGGCQTPHPVLFVHGSGLDASSWAPMRREFVAAGYPEQGLMAVDLLPNDGSNIAAAERQLAPAVAGLLEAARIGASRQRCPPPRKVDIVAHSMGAMSSRWYAARIGPEFIRNLIAIAPANHGTDALCGLEGAGNRELCPAFAQDHSSHVLQTTLNGTEGMPVDETPFGIGLDSAARLAIPADSRRRISFTVFWLDLDEWIRPAHSAVLDGTGGLILRNLPATVVERSSGDVLWSPDVGHDQLPQDPALIRVVVSSLMADGAE